MIGTKLKEFFFSIKIQCEKILKFCAELTLKLLFGDQKGGDDDV